MKSVLILLSIGVMFAFGFGCSSSSGGSLPPDAGAAADAGSPSQLDAGTDAGTSVPSDDLAAVLNSIRGQNDLPALGAAIFSSDETLALAAVGVRKSGDSTEVTTADKWHLGSNTKAMTATLAALVVEQGLLDWDSTISETFPEWSAEIDPGYRSVTLEMLLGHRGGAPANPPADVWAAMWESGESALTRRSAVQIMLGRAPAVLPGTQVLYSNAGYMIAGAMIEKATGSTWEDLIQTKLFGPLDMGSCGFGAPATDGRVDQPWGHKVVSGQPVPVPPMPAGDNPPSLGPAGTVHCSLADYGKFLTLHLQAARGHALLLSAESFKRLHTPVMSDAALGWFAVTRNWSGGLALTHSGSNTYNFVTVWMAPNKDRVFVVVTNRGDSVAASAVDATFVPLIETWAK